MPLDDVEMITGLFGTILDCQLSIVPGQRGVNLSDCRRLGCFRKSALLSLPAYVIIGGGVFCQRNLHGLILQ
jgi:hypothetical protein